MKWAYYNDLDPNCCAWLRELIAERLIMDGEVDCRSITEVRPDEVRGFIRRHWFAGIGGWDYALQIAGWPDDRPVDTVSCPCQPFSAAGLQMGSNDPRHLFPAFRRLIARCGGSTIFGEQVASNLGREWLARVRVEMATLGYAVSASDLCAAGVAAPQLRQRLYWMADSSCARSLPAAHAGIYRGEEGAGLRDVESERHGGSVCGLADAERSGLNGSGTRGAGRHESANGGSASRLAHTHDPRPQGRSEHRDRTREWAPWSRSVGVCGNDGTWRRLEPGIPPLAARIPGRVALIRGSGNSIVPILAARFIQACEDAQSL